jgi:hypothetical protein
VLGRDDVEHRTGGVGDDDDIAADNRQAAVGAVVREVPQAMCPIVCTGPEEYVVRALPESDVVAGG